MLRLFSPKSPDPRPLPVKAAAAPLPKIPAGSLGSLPAFSPVPEKSYTGSSELTGRAVRSDPRELWYLGLQAKLTPRQVLQILRSALGGDLWQQWQLLSLMLDTWPMFRKCTHEVRSAVAGVTFTVEPARDEGGKASKLAQEKAELVRRAMRSFAPDPFTDEKEWTGMVYDLTDAMLNGLTMVELMWQEKNGELLPRAAAWVHPRHYTFAQDGRLAVIYNGGAAKLEADPNKYLVGQFMSRSGSSLGAGLMRCLAWDWSAVVFNREWMLSFAQVFGSPFLDATYEPGTPDHEIVKLNQFLAEAGSQRWINHVKGSEVNITAAQTLGRDNPQARIMDMADDHCQVVLLGQTATTRGTPGKLGGEQEHGKVKREVVEGVASYVATGPLTQFARAVCRVNYGNEDDVPTVKADFTEVAKPLEQAERWTALTGENMPPTLAEEFYADNSLTMPKPGDIVIHGGRVGQLGSLDGEISMEPAPAPGMGPDGEPLAGGTPSGALAEDDEAVAAAVPVRKGKVSLRQLVVRASDEDLAELRRLLADARAAGHVNGEWDKVTDKLDGMRGGRR